LVPARIRATIGRMDTQTASLTVDGMTVTMSVERTDDGLPLIVLSSDSYLEGIAPGEYVLQAPVHAATA
jgi:hypothetical protein